MTAGSGHWAFAPEGHRRAIAERVMKALLVVYPDSYEMSASMLITPEAQGYAFAGIFFRLAFVAAAIECGFWIERVG